MNVWYVLYVLYFLVSVSVIHWMARILSKTSLTYWIEALQSNSDLALLMDRVIIASFFLANVGFVVWDLPTYVGYITTRQALAILLEKLGSAMLFLGFTLFLGLWIFARMRRFGAPAR